MKNYFSWANNFAQHEHIESVLKLRDVIIDDVNKNKIDISIVITTYRRAELLKHAIQSALDQVANINYEILVVDNDYQVETSETEAVVRSFNSDRIKYFQNKDNLGMFGNWNRGILLASGRWVTILHDDDYLKEDYLSSMAEILESDTRTLLSCNIDIDDQRESEFNLKKPNFYKKIKDFFKNLEKGTKTFSAKDYFYRNRHMGTLGVLFSRENAIQIGGFDASDYPSADYFFFAKYVAAFGSIHLYKKLAVYRIFKNESMKDNVMQMWVIQCYDFRRFLIEQYFKNSRYKVIFSKLLAVNEAFNYKKDWGGSYDEIELLKKIGVGGFFISKSINYIFRAYLKLLQLVKI